MIFSVWVLIYLFAKAVKSYSSVGIKILFMFLAVLVSLVPASLEALNFLKILTIVKIPLMILTYFVAIFLFLVFVSKSKPEEIV